MCANPMRGLGRREFLKITVVAAAASGASKLVGCSKDPGEPPVAYPQGVASGDPRQDSVVVWTRVESEDGASQQVTYELALDDSFSQLVAEGQVDADASSDHTVRVKITGLEPYTRYYYRFACQGVFSDVGRTKTAPAADADVSVRLAVVYGQAYVGRYFHAWKVLVEQEEDIDFVLFLGDYIYESESVAGASEPTPERRVELPDGMIVTGDFADGAVAVTVNDYRTLYRTWRTDEHLQRAHQMFPFITVWDDHEFTNDCWGDHANDFNGAEGEEQDTARRNAATQAFYEYLPLDVDYDPAAGFPNDIRIYRSFRFGQHLELFVADQRYYRDDHVIPEGPTDPDVGKTQENSMVGSRILTIKDVFDLREADANPTMLGDVQRTWLVDGMTASTATWKVLGSATILAQMLLDLTPFETLPSMLAQRFYFKLDHWDGYRSERARLLTDLATVENLVVLTGDIHATYVSDLHADFDAPGPEPVAVEYIGPSISSLSLKEQLTLAVETDPLLSLLGLQPQVEQVDDIFLDGNPHFHYANSRSYGYAIAEVDRDQELRVTMVHLQDVLSPESTEPIERVRFRTPAGTSRIDPI
jgi:alkaline phosphatase D